MADSWDPQTRAHSSNAREIASETTRYCAHLANARAFAATGWGGAPRYVRESTDRAKNIRFAGRSASLRMK